MPRFKQDKDGTWLQFDEDTNTWGPDRSHNQSKGYDFDRPAHWYLADISEFTSPIDGARIDSRSKLRRHEATYGVRQAGDFKPGELIAREKKRIERQKEFIAKHNSPELKWT